MSKRQLVLSCCLVGLLATPVPAQEPVDTDLEEREGVVLRLIDVVVTTKKDAPVTGLDRDDFVVDIDGVRREVASLDRGSTVIGQAPPPGDAPRRTSGKRSAAPDAEPVARNPRWVVICLDADRMPPNYRKVVLSTARAVIRESGDPDDRFAVTLLRDGNLTFVHHFARPSEFNFELLQDPGMLLGRSQDLRFRLNEVDELVRLCIDQPNPERCALTRSEEFLAIMRQESEAGVQALRGLITAIAPLPGRKALVWFSNGFVTQPGAVVQEAIQRYIGEAPDLESRLGTGETYIEDVLADATRARVTFFSLKAGPDMSYDLRGADKATVPRRVSGFVGDPFRLATTLSGQTLRDAATVTGGKAIFTPLGPDLAPGLLRQLDGVYTLGIDALPGDGRKSKVKVRLRDKKLGKVRVHKRLPSRQTAPPEILASLVLSSDNAAGKGVRVDVSFELRSVAVEKDRATGYEQSRVAVYSHVRRKDDGRVRDGAYTLFEVPRTGVDEPSFMQPLWFELPPGEYVAEVFLSDLVGGGRASASAPVVVEGSAEDPS